MSNKDRKKDQDAPGGQTLTWQDAATLWPKSETGSETLTDFTEGPKQQRTHDEHLNNFELFYQSGNYIWIHSPPCSLFNNDSNKWMIFLYNSTFLNFWWTYLSISSCRWTLVTHLMIPYFCILMMNKYKSRIKWWIKCSI